VAFTPKIEDATPVDAFVPTLEGATPADVFVPTLDDAEPVEQTIGSPIEIQSITPIRPTDIPYERQKPLFATETPLNNKKAKSLKQISLERSVGETVEVKSEAEEQARIDAINSGEPYHEDPLAIKVIDIPAQLVVGGVKMASSVVQFLHDTTRDAVLSETRRPVKEARTRFVDEAQLTYDKARQELDAFEKGIGDISALMIEDESLREIKGSDEKRKELWNAKEDAKEYLGLQKNNLQRVERLWQKEDSTHRVDNIFANFRATVDRVFVPSSSIGAISQVLGQYASPLILISGLSKAQGARAFFENTFGGSLGATLATGPEHNNLANLLNDYAGLDNAVIKMLQIEGDDSTAEARMKNLAIDFGLTGTAVAAFKSFGRLMRNMKKNPLSFADRYADLTVKNAREILMAKSRIKALSIKEGQTVKQAEIDADEAISVLMGRKYDKGVEIQIMLKGNIKPPKIRDMDEADKFILSQKTMLEKQFSKFSKRHPWLTRFKLPDELRDIYAIASDEIGKISPTLQAAVRKQQMNLFIDTHTALEKASPLINMMGKLRSKDKKLYDNTFSLAVHNRDNKRVIGVLSKRFGKEEVRAAMKGWAEVREDILIRLRDTGYEKMGKLSNFFHREVIDYKGLREFLEKKLGVTSNDIFTHKIVNGVRQALDDDEVVHQINSYMAGANLQKNLSHYGATKQRSIHSVEKEMLKFYADPLDAMALYIERSIANASKRKFFGKGNVLITGEASEDLKSTIGSYVSKLNIDDTQRERLKYVLDAIYGGRNSEWVGFRNMRGMTSAAFLGNPESALTQLGDLGVTAAQHGIRSTTRALGEVLFKDAPANIQKNLGISNVGLEHTDMGVIQSSANQVMKWSGFQAADHLGKNVNINAALISARDMLSTPRGMIRFYKQYEGILDQAEITQLASDLAGKNFTPLVKFHMWNSLTNVQPISKAEMPMHWLKNPNLRLMYQFTTFFLKQLSNIKRTVGKPLSEGRPITAAANITKYGAYFYGATLMAEGGKETLKSFLPGGDGKFDFDQVTERTMTALLRMLAYSDYQVSNTDGVVRSFLASTGILDIPLVSFADNLLAVIFQTDSADEAWKMFPLVGKNIHRWIGHGADNEASDAGWNTDFGSGFDTGFDEGF